MLNFGSPEVVVGLLAALAIAACQPSSAPPTKPEPATSDLAAADRGVQLSHELLEAYDRGDDARFKRLTTPSFVWFDAERIRERNAVSSELLARQPQLPRTREYESERAWFDGPTGVYRGASTEQFQTEAAATARELHGWNTISWTNVDGAWRALSWQWTKAGLAADPDIWDATYRDRDGARLNPAPNQFLVQMVSDVPAGRALDVGMGQGRNALYLAAHGWSVTGIDSSPEALRQAREQAEARHLKLEAVLADIDSWEYGEQRWDLIVVMYMGCPTSLVPKLRASLRPDGLLIAEHFHHDALPDIGTDQDEFARAFAESFEIVRNDAVDAVSDWGNPRALPEKLVRFVARKR
jgi:SAM-dependent methyltransferase